MTIKENIEEKIMNSLLADCRKSLGNISLQTNIPISTIYLKIKKLEKDKIIKKWVSLIDTKYLRYQIEIFFHVLLKEIPNSININSMLKLNKNNEYFIQAYFKNLVELEEFKKKIKKNGKIFKSFIAYELIKKEQMIIS